MNTIQENNKAESSFDKKLESAGNDQVKPVSVEDISTQQTTYNKGQ